MNKHHQVLIDLLKNHFGNKKITGIEIGTNYGELALDVSPACLNILILYTIDPYQHKEGNKFEAGLPQETLDGIRILALNNLKHLISEGRVIMLHLLSDSAYYLFNDKVDFVWIDGDHSPEQIAKDFKYERLVKHFGLIGGHDFGNYEPMTEIIKLKYKDEITIGEDFTWWHIKRGLA